MATRAFFETISFRMPAAGSGCLLYVSYSPSGRYRVSAGNRDARTVVTVRDRRSGEALARVVTGAVALRASQGCPPGATAFDVPSLHRAVHHYPVTRRSR